MPIKILQGDKLETANQDFEEAYKPISYWRR